jgi:hypothetical protein
VDDGSEKDEEEEVVLTAKAPESRPRKIVVVQSPADKYSSQRKLSSLALIAAGESPRPASSSDPESHACELTQYQFRHGHVKSLLGIPDLNARKIAFKTMVRAMFRDQDLISKENFQCIKLLIRVFVENNWSFLEFLLHFEIAVFEIKDNIKDTCISALVPFTSRTATVNILRKRTRRIINSIFMQIMGLFKNYIVSGDDTHSQSMAIASLWPGMAITDMEI